MEAPQERVGYRLARQLLAIRAQKCHHRCLARRASMGQPSHAIGHNAQKARVGYKLVIAGV